jgi:inosine/xanthosine triphosphate pyrophosphatase family protein
MIESSRLNIILGTGNPDKLRALSSLLDGLPLKLLSLQDVCLGRHPEENDATHYGNAALKAKHWSFESGGLVIASDGGLVIPSMFGSWSSLYTNRIFIDMPPAERPSALLRLLEANHLSDRRAFWLESVVVACSGDVLASWVARSSLGVIALKVNTQVSTSEFWVNSVWDFPELFKHYESLDAEEMIVFPDHWVTLKPKVISFFESYLARTD